MLQRLSDIHPLWSLFAVSFWAWH